MPPGDVSILAALSDSVFSVGGGLSMDERLGRLVALACRLAGARYGALGLPDEDGDFARFVTAGMTADEIAAIGPLPRTHGLLGEILRSGTPLGTPDIAADPRFQYWPARHPRMGSFLGVPIRRDDEVIGAFYLTDRQGAPEFSAADQEAVEALAGHAAIAIENARLYEALREFSIVGERQRLAGELHDSVVQTLFSLSLLAEAAAGAVDDDPEGARRQLAQVRELAGSALGEMRSLVYELRPGDLERDGLEPALRTHLDVLRRVHRADIRLSVSDGRRLRGRVERELLRIATEALSNALRHSGAGVVSVEVCMGQASVVLTVSDDGAGFDPDDPGLRAQHLGLTSMEERAATLGGRLTIDSSPGQGTRITAEVPVGR
ncbi:MAG: GAF domain-containing sensor histidine kinase [Acidimicrobiia bacterium]